MSDIGSECCNVRCERLIHDTHWITRMNKSFDRSTANSELIGQRTGRCAPLNS